MDISVIDRKTGHIFQEKIFGERVLRFLYGGKSWRLATWISRCPFFSACYGFWQRMPWTKRKIASFVHNFNININENEKKISDFSSFNDFFVRSLKKSVRPLAFTHAVMPADARYQFFFPLSLEMSFKIKDNFFSLERLLGDASLAKKYVGGTLVFARLAPSDCHRFYFPCDALPSQPRLIRGSLFSVNPIALTKRFSILSENKRLLTYLDSECFGRVLHLAVGATNVGSITYTFTSQKWVAKGSEMGFFSFGASALLLLFKPHTITLAKDLQKLSQEGLEIYAHLGSSLSC